MWHEVGGVKRKSQGKDADATHGCRRKHKGYLHGPDVRAAIAALAMRAVYALVELAAGWHIAPYDTSAVLRPGAGCAGMWEPMAARWDALWAAHVAQKGYEHEQQLVVFPGTPLMGWLLNRECPELAGVAIGALSHALAGVFVRRSAERATGRPAIGARAACLWALAPSSPFQSCLYAEAPFGLAAHASVSSLLGGSRLSAGALAVAAASLRSNGCLLFLPLLAECAPSIGPSLASAAPLMPALLAQLFAALRFCATGRGVERPEWCDDGEGVFMARELPYGYLQRRYWGLGFLRFWRVEQIPNIALGLPAACVALGAAKEVAAHDPVGLFTLGLARRPRRTTAWLKPSPACLGLALTWILLASLALCAMHVQVATRLLASWPGPLWFLASVSSSRFRTSTRVIGCYALVGSVLFATFYPWT